MYVSFALLQVNIIIIIIIIIITEQTELYHRITCQNPGCQWYQENLLKTEKIDLLNYYERTL
jgi:hypothetical protein